MTGTKHVLIVITEIYHTSDVMCKDAWRCVIKKKKKKRQGPVQIVSIILEAQFPRISLYALTFRFVLIEITKVDKPVH